MPVVTATPRPMRNGQVITQFVDSVGTASVTYTYPTAQEILAISNTGDADITVTVAGMSQTIQRGKKWSKTVEFTSFSIVSSSGLQSFEAWADEKGSVFDSPEGLYFQSNGGGGGSGGGSGGGLTVYPTLAALQSALPGGASSPVWVTADSKWYYWTGAVTTPTPTAPVTPSTPTATPGNNQVALSWPAVSGATSYKVYRGGTLLASPTTNSYNDTTAVNGTAYTYTVSAVNSAGESAQSTSASATPVAPSTAPATPSTPTATAGNNQVSLTWGAVSGATSYKVYRNGSNIASPTTNSYTDTTAVNGTTYSYTVSAVNSIGESAQSSSVSATPSAPVQETPSTIAGLVTWLDASSITGVTDGSAVSSIPDKSGNNKPATQATASKQPIYVANGLNGKGAVRFDGVDDSMVSAASCPTGSGARTVFIVVTNTQQNTSAATNALYSWGSSVANQLYSMDSRYSAVTRWIADYSGPYLDSNTNTTAAATLITQKFDGATDHLYLGGTLKNSAVPAAAQDTKASSLYVGSRPGDVMFAKTDLCELLIYNSALNDTDRAAVESYLKTKWGVV